MAAKKKTMPMAKQKVMAKPKVFLILGISLAPKNWDIKAAAPLEKPKRTPQWIKNNWVDRPTEANWTSPRLPTIRVSIKFREDAIKLCKAIGRAIFLRVPSRDLVSICISFKAVFLSVSYILLSFNISYRL